MGLSNTTTNSTSDIALDPMPGASSANETTPIIENKQSTNSSMPIKSTSVLKYEYGVTDPTASNIQSNVSVTDATIEKSVLLAENGNSTSAPIVVATAIGSNQIDAHRRKRSVSSISPSSIASSSSDIYSTHIVLHSTNAKSQSNISDITSNLKSNDLQNAPDYGRTNTANKLSKGAKKNRNEAIIGHISVLIHNMSVITNGDKDYSDNLEKEWVNPGPGYALLFFRLCPNIL